MVVVVDQTELVLRCPDAPVAERSLAALFGVEPNHFRWALCEAAAAVEAEPEAELKRAIVPALTTKLGRRAVAPSRIHFFHGTRAFNPQLFEQYGVLPLRAVLDELWIHMCDLAPEIKAKDFVALRRDLEDGRIEALTYKHRLDSHDDGPNGVLVRDVLVNPQEYHSSELIRIPRSLRTSVSPLARS